MNDDELREKAALALGWERTQDDSHPTGCLWIPPEDSPYAKNINFRYPAIVIDWYTAGALLELCSQKPYFTVCIGSVYEHGQIECAGHAWDNVTARNVIEACVMALQEDIRC